MCFGWPPGLPLSLNFESILLVCPSPENQTGAQTIIQLYVPVNTCTYRTVWWRPWRGRPCTTHHIRVLRCSTCCGFPGLSVLHRSVVIVKLPLFLFPRSYYTVLYRALLLIHSFVNYLKQTTHLLYYYCTTSSVLTVQAFDFVSARLFKSNYFLWIFSCLSESLVSSLLHK